MNRKVVWVFFLCALAMTFVLKAVQLGWFEPRLPLALDGEPVLLFFNKSRGCECELLVYNNANMQMNAWDAPVRVVSIDMEQRPDLVQQFIISRAPSLVLLSADGQVVWRQNKSRSDKTPLDLDQVELQVKALRDGNLP